MSIHTEVLVKSTETRMMRLCLIFLASSVVALTTPVSSRRAVLYGGTSLAAVLRFSEPSIAADLFGELRSRLDAPLVKQLSIAPMAGKEPRLPSWLAGRWQAEQTLQRYSAPLGVQYIGAAGRPLAEAEASAAQTRAQIGKPVALELRWAVAPEGGAVEDRAFNARSRLDAFAGRQVVRSSTTCAEAGVDAPGIACTFVDFNGPIVQKQFVNSVKVALAAPPQAEGAFISSEIMRAILARRKVAGDTRDFPPLTVDSEVLLSLAPTGRDNAVGRVRLVEFLNPQAPLYFAAGGSSVSISDYSLTLTRSDG